MLIFSFFQQINIHIPIELIQKLAILGVILAITWLTSKIIGKIMFKTTSRFNQNLAQETRRITTWLIWLIGIFIGLDQLGLDLTLLLMILSLGGLMFLIAFRDILSNIASREVIMTYTPFKIGDWISIGKIFGRVEEITWMYTSLTNTDNEIVHVPNSKIIRNVVKNETSPGGIRISVPIIVDRDLDLFIVERKLLDIGDELSEELPQDSKPEVRVINTTEHSVKLVLLLKIINPAKRNYIFSEVQKKAKQKLDEVALQNDRSESKSCPKPN